MSYYVTKINENGNIAVDDTLLVKGAPAAAGSKILKGFLVFSSISKPKTAEKRNALIIEYYNAGYGQLWIQKLAAAYTEKYGQEVVTLPRSGERGIVQHHSF